MIGFEAQRQMAVSFSQVRLGTEAGSAGVIRSREAAIMRRVRGIVHTRCHTGPPVSTAVIVAAPTTNMWNGNRPKELLVLMTISPIAQ